MISDNAVFSAAFKWHDVGLDVLGKLDVGDVKFRLPFNHLSRVGEYSTKCLSTSAVIAVLGFLVGRAYSWTLNAF